MAAIFDMDGLLLNTDPVIWVESMLGVAASHNIPVTEKLLKKTKGLRIYEVTAFWAGYFGWEEPLKSIQLAEEILDKVIAISYEKGKLMPGVVTLLEGLKSEGVPIGLATSSPKRLVDSLLDFFQIRSYFGAISTASEELEGKPHPAVYLDCASQLGVLPWHCLAFEDSVNGMVAAKAARMAVVVVPDIAQRSNPQFGLADLQVNSLEEFTAEDYYILLAV